MFPFSLIFLSFFFFLLVGCAAFSFIAKRLALRHMLLAPALGLSITVLSVFSLSRLFQLPVLSFAWYLFLFLCLTSIFIIGFKRSPIAWRQYRPFIVVWLMAILTIAFPFFTYGFNWLSILNDDMVNYCLEAQRFLQYGYDEINRQIPLTMDYSQAYIGNYRAGARPGSELLLAFYSALLNKAPQQLFMTLTFSFYLISISAMTGLLACYFRNRQLHLWFAIVAASSALWAYGAIVQLIGQMGGLALLALSLYAWQLLLRAKKFKLEYIVFAAVTFSALIVEYIELLPFFGVVVIVSWVLFLFKNKAQFLVIFSNGISALLGVTICLNTSLILFFDYLYRQAQLGVTINQDPSLLQFYNGLFYYYLVPSGIPSIWNIFPVTLMYVISPMVLNITIILGFILSGMAFYWCIRYGKRAGLITLAFVSISGMGLLLFVQQSGFGLFKLAMYIQPFLWAVFVLFIFCFFPKDKHWFFVVAILVLMAGKISQVVNTTGEYSGVGVMHISAAQLDKQFHEKMPKDPNISFMVNALNLSLGKFYTLYTKDHYTYFAMGCDLFNRILTYYGQRIFVANDNNAQTVKNMGCKKNQDDFYFPGHEDLLGKIRASDPLAFVTDLSNQQEVVLITSSNNFTNRLQHNREPAGSVQFNFISFSTLQDYLVNILAQKAVPYYLYGFRATEWVGYFQAEQDGYYPEKTMVRLNRANVFQWLKPSEKPRMMLDITASFNGAGNQKLPSAHVLGQRDEAFDLVGYGSARVFSAPVEPYLRKAQSYVVLDLGEDGQRFSAERQGFMKLYGNPLALDNRYSVIFARDVSALSDKTYQALDAPALLRHFPDDLSNPSLEYSGIYEDGWVGDEAYMMLRSPKQARQLLIEGKIPSFNHEKDPTTLQIWLDGNMLAEKTLSIGDFSVKITLDPLSAQRHRVELRFSNLRPMPDVSQRPVTALLTQIGFF